MDTTTGPSESARDRDATARGATSTGIAATVATLRRTYELGVTRPLEWRDEQLGRLQLLLAEGEDELLNAMASDIGKPAVEGRLTDLSVVDAEIAVMRRNMERWARPERVSVPLVQRPGRARVLREPLGVALVIAPWNYPVHLLLLPMASAICAGNCVIGKPSELAPATSEALARLIPRFLDLRAVGIVEGGPDETQALLAERFDSIFYTGNGRVGRIVMEAAARHLTPVTLELGGKSPAIVAADADLRIAARRIAWGKWLNAGQTCVAPDYVLVERSVENEFVEELRKTIHRFYGSDPSSNGDYARIVNDGHFERLANMLRATSADVAIGGETDAGRRFITPTVLTKVADDDTVMDDEIFGPILPVIAVDDVNAAIHSVAARPKPLALYVFSGSEDTIERVLAGTSSGGVGVNCTVVQLAIPELPFGGVGPSGMGAYHGRWGFETFSHRRAVLAKPTRPDLPIAYPPYTRLKERILKRVL